MAKHSPYWIPSDQECLAPFVTVRESEAIHVDLGKPQAGTSR